MNKKLLLLSTALLCASLCMAKKAESRDSISVKQAFIDLPMGVLDILSYETRVSMVEDPVTIIEVIDEDDEIIDIPLLGDIDNMDDIGMELEAITGDNTDFFYNDLNGQSQIDTLTNDFMQVKVSDASTLQLKVLQKKNGDDVVLCLYTTGTPDESRDTDISFFDSRMNPLPKKNFFPEVKLSDFFDTRGYKTKMKEIEEILPFYTYYFEVNPDNNDITGKLTYSDRLPIEDAKILELFLKPEITFLWDGAKYKLSR